MVAINGIGNGTINGTGINPNMAADIEEGDLIDSDLVDSELEEAELEADDLEDIDPEPERA